MKIGRSRIEEPRAKESLSKYENRGVEEAAVCESEREEAKESRRPRKRCQHGRQTEAGAEKEFEPGSVFSSVPAIAIATIGVHRPVAGPRNRRKEKYRGETMLPGGFLHWMHACISPGRLTAPALCVQVGSEIDTIENFIVTARTCFVGASTAPFCTFEACDNDNLSLKYVQRMIGTSLYLVDGLCKSRNLCE